MHSLIPHSAFARVALLSTVISIASAVFAWAGPYWQAPPRGIAYEPVPKPPLFRQRHRQPTFQQPIQPNVRLPQKPRTPFGAGRAAVPPRIPRIRQFGANDPVRQFLFGPTKRPGFKPPLVTALDLDGNNLIDADELLNAAEALQRLDANGDGKIGPAEWAPRPGVGTNIFLPDDRGRGKQPGRPTVGEGRPGTSAKSDAKSEKAREKKRKRDRATKRKDRTPSATSEEN